MRNDRHIIALILLLTLCVFKVISQPSDTSWAIKYDSIVNRVRLLENTIPGLNEKVTNSVTGVPLNEFLRAVAISSGVNLSIDPKLNFQVINNFSETKISDILLFLCDQYRFDISSIGSIIMVKAIEIPVIPDRCDVIFDTQYKTLSLNVDNAELGTVARKITDATGQNVIPGNGLLNQRVKIYAQKLPISAALDKMAFSNNLVSKLTEDGIFLIEKAPVEKPETPQPKATTQTSTVKPEKEGVYKLNVNYVGKDSLSIISEKAPISEVLREISAKSGNNYTMTSIPKGEITLQINGAGYQDILRVVLSGTDHVFKKLGNIYLIGNKSYSELMEQTFIQLQYRTVDSVLSLIPKDLIADIETRLFREQNSLMLSGPADKVKATENFIRYIDRLVPVVSIEVLIIDFNASFTITSGITAGITNEQVPPTSGNVFPALEMNLNSQSINDLLNRFNGFGWAKIGKVTPNFYVQLKAMENQGILNIRSTPILSTLNGHETRLSIGNTEYYLEEQFNIIGTQNPQSTKIQTYKPVEAELEIIITPVVSGDDQITLEVEVNQSDFTARISTNAPPGKVSRTFKSQIRVKNEEMILLGGLEENRNNLISSGTPFLSRIPVIKWLFSAKTEEKSKSKLNIFIKPTIIS